MLSRIVKSHMLNWELGLFLLLQVGTMLLAISRESLWIDEFWNAYFASLGSIRKLYEGLSAPYGSQTPLHFIYGYFWAKFVASSEVGFRLSNLPLFVVGQASLFWALRPYPKDFVFWFLALCALHPLIWQYANELRPYIMIYAGAQMILAYIFHIHASKRFNTPVSPLASVIFFVGSVLLFGASLLGVFWVATAGAYIVYFRFERFGWSDLKERSALVAAGGLLVIVGLLTFYYLNSLLHGGGASRLATTTVSTLLFDFYELLGLSGIGPSRLELRDIGFSALMPYGSWLVVASVLVLISIGLGFQEVRNRVGTNKFIFLIALALAPIAVVISSGFIMHWRVLGRHMIATIPLLNLLIALGLVKSFNRRDSQGRLWRSMIGAGCLLVFIVSSLSMRFADRHRKDDYRAAAAVAIQELTVGKRVWWAADALGAKYYAIPGEFDYMAELTNIKKAYVCIDRPGVQAVSDASGNCLERLEPPDTVIFSKPDTFDKSGAISAYLKAGNFVRAQELPAFTIWRRAGDAEALKK